MDRAIKGQDPTMLKLCKNILRSSKSDAIHGTMKVIIIIYIGFHQRKAHENCHAEIKK